MSEIGVDVIGVGRISMDGRGRCLDKNFIEPLWRSLSYEAIHLHEIADGFTARLLIGERVRFCNAERPEFHTPRTGVALLPLRNGYRITRYREPS